MNKILVINAGSSTIKWKVFAEANLDLIAEGVGDRIGIDGLIVTKYNGQKHTEETTLKNHLEAIQGIANSLKSINIIKDVKEITAIGHRVVHGGAEFKTSAILTEENINKIDELSVLAPLHNPNAVSVIRACIDIFGEVFQTATFDTSFHTTIPKVNSTYPINKVIADELKIKKYGFHGTSHRYVTQALQEILKKGSVTFINAHVGNGASMCAIKDSKSFDTSMGLTPLAGLMMGTRSGDIDPSIIKFIMDNKKMSIDEIDTLLNNESGMKGVSGISSDMRDVEDEISKGNTDAIFTFELYVQRAVDIIAQYANKLGNQLDALVFTAGIGENDVTFREQVVKKLTFDKIIIDSELNNVRSGKPRLISTPESNVPVYVIPTNEELMIAQDNKELNK